MDEPQPNRVPRGDLYWINGDYWKIIATSEDTQGAYALMDVTVSPKGGPKPHSHNREDETLYVLDGIFDIYYGDEKIRAEPGHHIFMRRTIPHAFKNIGSEDGRLLILFTPGGIEKMFQELGVPISDIHGFTPPFGFPNFAKAIHLLRKYGIEPKVNF